MGREICRKNENRLESACYTLKEFRYMKNKLLILLVIIISVSGFNNCSTKKDKKTGTIINTPVTEVSIDPTPGISIHDAAMNGQAADVTALLKAGIKVDSTDKDGRTPLMYAAFNGHSEIVSLLIRNGANVNLADNYGRTALMMAASGPNAMAVKILLDQKADPNMIDKEEHFSALMYAAAEGQAEVVRVLLLYNADPALKDIDGDDALTFAGNNGHSAVVALLRPLKK